MKIKCFFIYVQFHESLFSNKIKIVTANGIRKKMQKMLIANLKIKNVIFLILAATHYGDQIEQKNIPNLKRVNF